MDRVHEAHLHRILENRRQRGALRVGNELLNLSRPRQSTSATPLVEVSTSLPPASKSTQTAPEAVAQACAGKEDAMRMFGSDNGIVGDLNRSSSFGCKPSSVLEQTPLFSSLHSQHRALHPNYGAHSGLSAGQTIHDNDPPCTPSPTHPERVAPHSIPLNRVPSISYSQHHGRPSRGPSLASAPEKGWRATTPATISSLPQYSDHLGIRNSCQRTWSEGWGLSAPQSLLRSIPSCYCLETPLKSSSWFLSSKYAHSPMPLAPRRWNECRQLSSAGVGGNCRDFFPKRTSHHRRFRSRPRQRGAGSKGRERSSPREIQPFPFPRKSVGFVIPASITRTEETTQHSKYNGDYPARTSFDARRHHSSKRHHSRSSPGRHRSSLPNVHSTLDLRTSAQILHAGDWFYKWNRRGCVVHPRWVWVDTKSYLLVWSHRETHDPTFSGSLRLENIIHITPRELEQMDKGGTLKTYFVLMIETPERVLQLATEIQTKINVWFESLKNVVAFVRRQDIVESTLIPD